MSIDYHTAQGDFGSIVNNLQPMVLSNFVMWLDLKVAEFKVYGQMILDGEQDMSKWFLHPPNAGGGTQSIPRRKSETVTTASVHNKHRRPPSLGSTNIPSKQIKTEHVVHRRNVQKNDPVSIDLTDNEALTEMTVSDLSQTPGDEAFSLQHLKQEPQLTPSSPKTVPSPVRRPSFVERSVLQNVKNTEHIYSEQPSHLPSSTFSPSSQIAEKSNVSSSLDSSQMSSKQNQQQTLADIHNVMTLKAEPEESEFECITKEEQDISFDTSTASQLLDNVTVTSVIPNIAGVTDQEEAEYHSQTIMKNDGTMFVVDSEQQQTIERQHGIMMVKEAHAGLFDAKEDGSGAVCGVEDESKKDYHCAWCGFTTDMYQQFMVHLEIHRSGKLACCHCHQFFNSKIDLDVHITAVHAPKSSINNQVKREIDKCHSTKMLQKMKYECFICVERFSNFSDYKNHVKEHDKDSSKAACKKCGKCFFSHRDFFEHCSTGQCMVYSCHLCSKTFTHRLYLQQHIAGKHERNQYVCPTCNKRFNWRSSLRNHKKECSVMFATMT